jgi:hypothetical protein
MVLGPSAGSLWRYSLRIRTVPLLEHFQYRSKSWRLRDRFKPVPEFFYKPAAGIHYLLCAGLVLANRDGNANGDSPIQQ